MKNKQRYAAYGCGLLVGFLIAAAAPLSGQDIIPVHHLFDITGDFNQPSDIALGSDGRIYVVDGVENQVKVFQSDGTFLFRFGRKGEDEGQFLYPMGIDIDDIGDVYIADTGNHRIQVFSREGTFQRQFYLEKWGAANEPDPVDIFIADWNGKCYISDNDNHRVLVCNRKGEYAFQWGRYGLGRDQFRYPAIVTGHAQRDIVIVDVLNSRLSVFDDTGQFQRHISEWGITPGTLYRPKGVVFDTRDNLFVSDSYTGIIQVFQMNGAFRGVLSTPDGEWMRFTTPTGMCIDENNRLLVVEMTAHRVGVYQLSSY